jgi:hypothetical protein
VGRQTALRGLDDAGYLAGLGHRGGCGEARRHQFSARCPLEERVSERDGCPVASGPAEDPCPVGRDLVALGGVGDGCLGLLGDVQGEVGPFEPEVQNIDSYAG